jgi:hypothetical protein
MDNSQCRSTEVLHESTITVSVAAQTSVIRETDSTGEIEVLRLQVAADPPEVSGIAAVVESIEVLPMSVDTYCEPKADAVSSWPGEQRRNFQRPLQHSISSDEASPPNQETGKEVDAPVDSRLISAASTSTDSGDVISKNEEVRDRNDVHKRPANRSESNVMGLANHNNKVQSTDDNAEVNARTEFKARPAVTERPRKPRNFTEPKPSPATSTAAAKDTRSSASTQNTDQGLPIRLQVIFGSGGIVKSLALILHRREGMPENLEISKTNGSRLRITESSEDSYESVPITEAELAEGIVFQAHEGTQRWRWELSKRDIYVLAAGDAFGLSGFVTRRKDQRLWLNAHHVIVAKETYRNEVFLALDKAGCGTPEIYDHSTVGIPLGWILFRGVTPTKAVPMLEERNILNVLCPSHEHEPQLVGGIRLQRNNWLLGFPPRIRFAGEIGDDFQVLIDNTPTTVAADGGFEAPGWDTEGEHRLWFGGRAETYALCSMEEDWTSWPAHNGASGKGICGASVYGTTNARWQQFCIPVKNPLLIGARPGDIFRCRVPGNPQKKWMLTSVPFTPVWALPAGEISPRSLVAAVLLEFAEPLKACDRSLSKFKSTSAIRKWGFAIRRAHRFRLKLDVKSEEALALWLRYGLAAKKLRKQKR